MTLTPVTTSSAISGHAYDPATQTLHLQFANGGTYAYPGVPAEKYAHLQAAPSLGKYVAQHIRPHHKGERL
jgi:KTSC domain